MKKGQVEEGQRQKGAQLKQDMERCGSVTVYPPSFLGLMVLCAVQIVMTLEANFGICDIGLYK